MNRLAPTLAFLPLLASSAALADPYVGGKKVSTTESCEVHDSTGAGIQAWNRPNGEVIGTLRPGEIVSIRDLRLVPDANNNNLLTRALTQDRSRPIVWVYRRLLDCKDVHAPITVPAIEPETPRFTCIGKVTARGNWIDVGACTLRAESELSPGPADEVLSECAPGGTCRIEATWPWLRGGDRARKEAELRSSNRVVLAEDAVLSARALRAETAMAEATPVPTPSTRATILRRLPTAMQKEIEETRASCREQSDSNLEIYDDSGLTDFTLSGGAYAVMVNDGEICGPGVCIKGANCHTGGNYVNVYVRSGNSWRKVLSGRWHPYISADWTKDPPALKSIIISLYGDDKNCPAREANLRAHGSTAWKHGQCDVIARWDGSRFTYKLLETAR
jgi:hypothetical protein